MHIRSEINNNCSDYSTYSAISRDRCENIIRVIKSLDGCPSVENKLNLLKLVSNLKYTWVFRFELLFYKIFPTQIYPSQLKQRCINIKHQVSLIVDHQINRQVSLIRYKKPPYYLILMIQHLIAWVFLLNFTISVKINYNY